MQVFKYPLMNVRSQQNVTMPDGARFRMFAMQGHIPMLWAEVEPGRQVSVIKLAIIGTGQEVPLNAVHLGSTIDGKTGEVWHLYEIERAP